ncbi:MAG: ATPase, partial [Mesorhizobium sp.]
MNSDHEIEVTEETSAPAEAIESASETALDHAAAAVEAADLSDEDEDGD